ncbi:cytochrome P450 [Aspergillus undulatus]|uniref:cytochrome P450 n=1 Tax=Aspergillus undulatus TaxID=1810928 RepID=UPI003CCD7745
MSTATPNFSLMGAGMALAVSIYLFCITICFYTNSQRASSIPLVNITKRKRLWLPGYLSYLFNADEILRQAYNTYSKHGRTCQIPNNAFGTSIILPTKYMPWLLSQPPELLNFNEWVAQASQARWTLGHSRYVNDESITQIQRVAIRAVVNTEIPQFQDELEHSIGRVLGHDQETWKDIKPAQALKLVLLQASSRYIVGSPLCANKTFIRWALIFIEIIFPLSEALRLVPSILRPIAGYVLSIPRWIVVRKLENLLRPTFDERLRALQSDDSSKVQPQDFLQQVMRLLYERNSPDLNIHFVTTHVLLFVLGAAFNTYMLASHVLYDILASDAGYNTIAEIQAELNSVFGDPDPQAKLHWTRREAEKLSKLDSILRECLRINSLSSQSMPRKVMVSGLQTPDGYTLPKGATIALLARAAQMDPDIYPDPERFIPFRHLGADGKRLVDTGPDFLPFGHGARSCPGRFLLAVEMKMLIAYILRHYELQLPVEYGGKQPDAVLFGEFRLPPQNGVIRVKRKKSP